MRNIKAFLKIFYRPYWVFETLKEKRSWVGIGLLVTALVYFEGVLLDVERFYQPGRDNRITTTRLVPIGNVDDERLAIKAGKYGDIEELTVTPRGENYVVFRMVRNKTLKDVILPFGEFAMVWWGFLGLHIVIGLDALYFLIVGKVMKLQMKFRDWLSLSIWSRVPMACLYFFVTALLGVVLDIHRVKRSVHLLNLEAWIEMPDVGNPAFSISFDYVGVGLIWVLVLQVIGFSVWARRNIAFSSAVVLLPTVIFYGGGLMWWIAN